MANAQDAFEAGHYDEAEAECRKALQISPKDPKAVRELGLIFFAEGRLAESSGTPALNEESRQLIQKLAQSGRDQASYHVALAMLKLLQRDNAGAEPELKRALELDPKSSAAYYETAGLDLLRHDEAAAPGRR